MAVRRLNFDKFVDAPNDTPIANLVDPTAKKVLATDKSGNIKVIKREDFLKEPVGDIIDVTEIQTDLEDGANVEEKYLKQDLYLCKKYFFDDFNREPEVYYDDESDWSWIEIKNFPLPDKVLIDGSIYRYPTDSEDIIIVLDNYPEMPPIGFHVRSSSPNIAVFEKLFQTHKFDSIKVGNPDYINEVSQIGKDGKGWHWICFHYRNNSWNYNRTNIVKGDALFKYFHWLFAKFNNVNIAE